MLRINRLKIVVETEKGKFGFDELFDKKINFIASANNTKGKSSCIEAIYYCLGLEELIGGKNEKSLKPVFRNELEYNGVKVNVLESYFYLEIKNKEGNINTIYRPGVKSSEKSNYIKVYKGSIEDIEVKNVECEEMYVHLSGSASNNKGFHKYLEEFIELKLPEVPSYDDINRKLYLQIIFSTIFTEQKRGWSDLFACMPTYYKIRDAKKRTIEFLIGLESLDNEKKRQLYKDTENDIKKEWEKIYNNINLILDKKNFIIRNLSSKPEIIDFDKLYSIYKYTDEGKYIDIDEYINLLDIRMNNLKTQPIIIGDNIDNLKEKIDKKQNEIMNMEELLILENKKLQSIELNIKNLEENIKNIKLDLQNNKDIITIKNLGSSSDLKICKDTCPTCNQAINDYLLPQNMSFNIMSIEENIRHLEAQKSMLEFTLKNYLKNKYIAKSNINKINSEISKSIKLLRSIKNDLYSIDSSISETIIREKIMIENEVGESTEIKEEVEILYQNIVELSKKWKVNLSNIAKLPKTNLTEKDINKIINLKNNFIKNLELYGYHSISNFSEVEICKDKLIPIVSGFDMKFDSSASDNVRAIWAFNVALIQTSLYKGGNHPNILIFDEPGQQSLIISDLCKFIKMLSDIDEDIQVIIGMTIDEKILEGIKSIDKSNYKIIRVDNNSIHPIK